MDGAAPGGDAGVRRRHSSHGENESSNDSAAAQSLSPVTINVSRPSTDSTHHVRFSAEVTRSNKKRKSDESLGTHDSIYRRGNGSSLAIDTSVGRAASNPDILGQGIVNSPGSVGSPSSPLMRQTISSPKSRSRGMSLRSSMFQKQLSDRTGSGNSAFELQEMGNPFAARNGVDSTGPRKKGSQTTVTEVAPHDIVSLSSSSDHKASAGAHKLPNYQNWIEQQARKHLPFEKLAHFYDRAERFVLRIQEVPPSKNGRQITFDAYRKTALIDDRTGKPFVSNEIRSSQYTPWNFVPRQLFAQFSKLANFYFLIISIMQMIPGLSTTGNYTTIIPLLFFVSISMAKEGYEDLRRHRLDKAENNREVNVLHAYRPVTTTDDAERAVQLDGPIHWSRVKWHKLQVGDVVKLERDEAIPADIIVLGSKGPNNVAYVETMALDGETNLKNKSPVPATIPATSTIQSLAAAKMHLVIEDPNLDLYNFEGKIHINDEVAALGNNEILYRGSILRNTPEIVGIIVNTGEECKIRMNANKNPRIKAPSLQAKVNRVVLIVVFIVLFMTIFNAAAYGLWHRSIVKKNAWYLRKDHVPGVHIVTGFIIMFNTMIPLSLYVSMEIIKVTQMLLLNDVDMYDPETNTPFEARTSTINEELGQVGYIFSDKTGTLTENIMRFRKLSCAGAAWLHDTEPKAEHPEGELLLHKKRGPRGKGKEPVRIGRRSLSRGPSSRPSTSHRTVASSNVRDESPLSTRRASTSQWKSHAMPEMAPTLLNTTDLINYVQRRPETYYAQKLKMMILSMAVCHTCLPEQHGTDEQGITYQASSPDELALVEAAKELGFIAFSRDAAILTVKLFPHGPSGEAIFESYEILDVIEFSSKRKRMSVVVRFPDGKIVVICKGADSMVMDRLRQSNLANHVLSKIEQRVMQRKSMEAEEVLRRKSSQIERKGSVGHFPRTSTSLARNSTTISRPSVPRLMPIRDEVDGWLNERENDVIASPTGPSNARASMALSERRQSVFHDDSEEDAIVEEALVADDLAELERCLQHITDFATEGLRTLLYAYRYLDDQEYRGWKKIYHDATTSLVDRQLMVERAGELIEQQLELGGATAIEDKLQKGVPETIDRLRRANIKMWMLTGDKRETAINIGHSCGLIKDYSSLTVLDHEVGDVEHTMAQTVIDINRGDVAHSVVVIDGQTLSFVESDTSLLTLFIDLTILVDSVICCRASPSQKAGLVNAIRKRVSGSVTLAIGDGANDIAMIQEAHVGIGITGREGLQAARTSDYAVAQFRFLTKLLLVHGRWNYIRTCKYVLGTFWKEFCFFVTAAFYQNYTGYTGTSLYEQWSLSMFNTLFTSLIVIMLGIFEQDLRASTLIAVPELYTKGQRSLGFNLRVYIGWMIMGFADAAIIFFSMIFFYAQSQQLQSAGLFPIGDMTFTACVILIAVKLQLIEQRYISMMAVIAMFASVGGWFLFNALLAALYHKNNEYGVKNAFFTGFGRQALWWTVVVFSTSTCILFELAVRALKNAYFPTDVETFQALEQDLDVRKRFEEASAPWMQAGWHHGSKRSSLELRHDEAEQARREREVQELLNRPRVMEEGGVHRPTPLVRLETEETPVLVRDGSGTDIQDILARRGSSIPGERTART